MSDTNRINLREKRSSFYITGYTNFSIPFVERDKNNHYLDPDYLLCLNCPLDNCYRDGMRDDATPNDKIIGRELCPIEIAKEETRL